MSKFWASNEFTIFFEFIICDVLRNLVPFEQPKKLGKPPWRSFTFKDWNFTKSNSPQWVFFFLFFWLKLYNAIPHCKKNISYEFTYHQDFEWVYNILWFLVPIWWKLEGQILFRRFAVVQKYGEGFQTGLTLFYPMFPFHSPWKHQKTEGFLGFSGGVKWEHWPEMGQQRLHAPVMLY